MTLCAYWRTIGSFLNRRSNRDVARTGGTGAQSNMNYRVMRTQHDKHSNIGTFKSRESWRSILSPSKKANASGVSITCRVLERTNLVTSFRTITFLNLSTNCMAAVGFTFHTEWTMLAQDDYKFKYISHVFRVKSKGLPQFAIFHMSLDGQPISWGQLLDSPRQATYIFHSRSIDARDCSCREFYPYSLAKM